MTVDLWLIFISLFLWSLGCGLYFFSWPLFVESLGATPVVLGYLQAFVSFCSTASYLPGGWLADRAERRWQLLLGWALVIPAPLFFLAARDWRGLLPGLALSGLSMFNLPALGAYLAAKARPGRLSSAMTIVYSGVSIGMVAGPLLAEPVSRTWGSPGVFRAAAVLYVLSFVALLPIARDYPRRAEAAPRFFARPDPGLVRTCLLFAGECMVLSLNTQFVAPFARDVLGHGVGWVNVAGAVTSLGAAVLAPVLGLFADRVGPRRGLALGMGLFAVAALGFAAFGRWPVVWVALFLKGSLDGVRTLMGSVIAHETPAEAHGRAMGLYTLLTGVGFIAGPMLGGWSYSWHPAAPFLLTFLTGALFCAHLFRTARAPGRQPAPAGTT
ncbi:MAG: MFS transporter [Chitinophagales bacterium]